MNILLNNNPEELPERLTIEKLLEKKNIKSKYYAVEINKKLFLNQNMRITFSLMEIGLK